MLGLSGLVRIFQERLQVSRRNAICRIIAFIFCCVLFLAVLACSAIFFTYNAKFQEKTLLLPGNHIEVKNILLDADFFVDGAQFMSKMEGNETFVLLSKKEEAVYYLTKARWKYIYKQIIPVPNGYWISSQQIKNGFVVSEIVWDANNEVLFHAILPSFALGAIGFVIMFVITWRSSPVHGEVSLTVW